MITRSTMAAVAALTVLGLLDAVAAGRPAAPQPPKKVTKDGTTGVTTRRCVNVATNGGCNASWGTVTAAS